ncbi:MAG: hypothetical protein JJE04_17815 [Acidobacteriia bacterium]|nr:hypothetical protein [Terriglobia bacterium]
MCTGCVSIPDSYAPPMQRHGIAGPDNRGLKHFIAMNDPAAPVHFLRDIGPTLENGLWRWTGQKPTLKFFLPSVAHLTLQVDFSIHDVILQQTGPITISYFINGHPLDKATYAKGGEQHFEKAVEESWLLKGSINVVSAELDKIYVAPDDGAKLGLTLIRAGFRE